MQVQTLPMERYIDHNGQRSRPLPAWATNACLITLYRDMQLTRTYDRKAVALQRTGKLGTYPSHLGAEAIGVGIGHAMHPNDVFIPYYRDMPAMWVRGIPMEKNLQYWGGDERGSDFVPIHDFDSFNLNQDALNTNNDVRRSNFQQDKSRDLPFCVPIATQCTHAVGVASALKIQHQHQAALVTCGDGATSKGDFLESINCAGAWNLPLVFVINNNQWAISVPRKLQCAADFLANKGIGAGIRSVTVDGNDVVAMYQATLSALDAARRGKGPTLIEAISYRLSDHTTADDASRYRDPDELEQAWRFEPLARVREYLESQHLWDQNKQNELESWCHDKVEQAVDNYLALINQAPESAFDFLYEQPTPDLQAQRDHLIDKVMRLEKYKQGGNHG